MLTGTLRHHVNALGLLYGLWGACGVLAGISLAVLAEGTWASVPDLGTASRSAGTAVWIFVAAAVLLGGLGGWMMAVGRSLRRFGPRGRHVAIVLAVPNLVLVPFGTALGIYTCWVLLNDDARREFGRPQRGALRHD
jgi:hypothetical protein